MATRVAVLSDTHGMLRPEVVAAVRTCAAVIHAGDFDNPRILEELQKLAPVYAVRGNNDWYLPAQIPDSLRFQIEDCRFFMVHDRIEVPRDLTDVDVVVFGHSHKYFEQVEDGRLWINPGSCGRRRFNSDVSYAIITVDGSEVTVEKHDIDAQ